jgi:hypothetical protein
MIKKLDINNKKDLIETINLIYRTFLSCNFQDSSKKLKEKMKRVFWESSTKDEAINLLKESEIVLISKEEWTINWMIRWSKEKIINLYIDTNTQWKWIWKKLVDKYIKIAKSLWSKNIHLKSSKYAYNFYIKLGFISKDEKYLEKNI